MSFDVVFNCAACSKTVKGKQHYAICVSCSRRVHRKYEIMIGVSQKGGDVVSDGCGYTYFFKKDYQNLRVWRCTHVVLFLHCNVTLKQIKEAGVDFLRTYAQEDFTLNTPQAHNHPPNNEIEQRQLPYVQLYSTTNGPSFNLENISAAEPARASAFASIDYQDTHFINPEVNNAKRNR